MAPGNPRLWWAAKAWAGAVFCLAGVIGGTGLYFSNLAYVRSGDESARSAAAARRAAVAQPSAVVSVGISKDLLGDSSAAAVLSMFKTYFSGINDHNYQQAVSVFDPSGIIDPNDSSQVQHFVDGVRTTSDSGIMLIKIIPSEGSAVQTAEVRFTSNNQAGFSPADNPDSTCTHWDVTYTLSLGSGGNYLIKDVSSASDSAC